MYNIKDIDQLMIAFIEYYAVDISKYHARIKMLKIYIKDQHLYDMTFIFKAVIENSEWFPTIKTLLDSVKIYENKVKNFDFNKALTMRKEKTGIEKRMEIIENKKMLID